MEIMVEIRQRYKTFSKTNKKLADFILTQPQALLKMTASEIAEHSQTSPASVVRFARNLGLAGLEELKIALASEQGRNAQKTVVDSIVSPQDSTRMICEKVANLVENTIEDLLYLIDEEKMQAAIEALRQAETVYLLGIGASALTGYNLYHKFNRAGKRAVFNFDPHMNLTFLHNTTPKDVVIAITYSGLTKEVLLGCQHAKKNQTPVILITRNKSESLDELADIRLLLPDNEHLVRVGAISSITSSMAVGDMLYLGSIQEQSDEEISKRMIETNRWVSQLKERDK